MIVDLLMYAADLGAAGKDVCNIIHYTYYKGKAGSGLSN